MPGSEVVHKQTLLGGAAGIGLLIFALAYRFYPAVQEPSQILPPKQSAAADPIMLKAQTPRGIDLVDNRAARREATQWGPPASLAPLPPPPPKAIAALLKRADSAFEKERILQPKDGALALYRQALDGAPKNAAANAGIEKVRDIILKQSMAALDRGDETDAARLIAALQDFALDDDDIPDLQMRLKRLRSTTPLLTQAAQLLHPDNGAGEPDAAQQNAALEIYRKVLMLDADNKLADAGLAQIERSYLDRARAAAAQDDFAGADETLNAASAIRPGSHELLDTRTQIEGIRRQRATAVMSQANSALDAGNADLAQLLAQKALGLSPDVGGVDGFNERLRNARLYASYKPGQILNDAFVDRNGKAPALVVVPTGEFLMGSPSQETGHRSSEEPQREIKLNVGFALARDELSVGEFRAFVDDSGYRTDAEKGGNSVIYEEASGRTMDRRGVNWRNDYNGATAADNLPVIHISWNDADAYTQWLSARTGKHYRLPSEAEYEYALRARSVTRFWWGDNNPTNPQTGNFTGDGDRSPSQRRWTNSFPHYSDGSWGPAVIGKYMFNPFGFRDIDGNVSAWVEDCWHDNYLRAPADSHAWVNPGCERHVVRGASWGSAPDQARSAFRTSLPADARNAQVGMRVARDL